MPGGALFGLPGGAVSWVTNDILSPRVTVNGVLASTAADGDVHVEPGAEVLLFDGSTVLDRLVVP